MGFLGEKNAQSRLLILPTFWLFNFQRVAVEVRGEGGRTDVTLCLHAATDQTFASAIFIDSDFCLTSGQCSRHGREVRCPGIV